MQGPAAKRREARRKYRTGIEQVSVRDDVLAQAGDRLIEHRQHQPILEVRGRRAPAAWRAHRLAILPGVETLAALAAHFFLRHELRKDLRRAATERRREHIADVQAHIETHHIGQLDRSHRHAEALARGIDHIGSDPFLERKDRLIDIGHQDPVDDKSWRAGAGQRELVEFAREHGGAGGDFGPGLLPAHDFYQLHLCNRIEKMDADEPAGIL